MTISPLIVALALIIVSISMVGFAFFGLQSVVTGPVCTPVTYGSVTGLREEGIGVVGDEINISIFFGLQGIYRDIRNVTTCNFSHDVTKLSVKVNGLHKPIFSENISSEQSQLFNRLLDENGIWIIVANRTGYDSKGYIIYNEERTLSAFEVKTESDWQLYKNELNQTTIRIIEIIVTAIVALIVGFGGGYLLGKRNGKRK